MWLNEKLAQKEGGETAFFATVTARDGDRVEASAHIRVARAPCVLPPGLCALPEPGDEVLLLPTREGYVCLGKPPGDSDGGYTLAHPGGAVIRLCPNGEIELNGLRVTREGTLIPKGSSQ